VERLQGAQFAVFVAIDHKSTSLGTYKLRPSFGVVEASEYCPKHY
jgi:hypothetical protein